MASELIAAHETKLFASISACNGSNAASEWWNKQHMDELDGRAKMSAARRFTGQGAKGTRGQGDKGTRCQGVKVSRCQGDKASRPQGVRMLRRVYLIFVVIVR